MRIRDPLYREIADLVVDTDRDSVRKVVQAIARHYRQHAANRRGLGVTHGGQPVDTRGLPHVRQASGGHLPVCNSL
jgi:hypothetical protein